jgi:acetylornithine deacetylase
MDHLDVVSRLAADLVRLDSRSFVSNLGVADRIEQELDGFEVERLDYLDAAGVAKRCLVAVRGTGGLALSGHMDTVPDTGWTDNAWSGRIDGDTLHGLGSTDMKGPVAAIIAAVRALPAAVPVALLLTTDEETTKQGAALIAERSQLARRFAPRAILVAEPTGMHPVRGHRSHIEFLATSTGVQAHSSTGRGRNANWALLPYLSALQAVFDRLRSDPTLQDQAYDPPFSDFNLVLDNFGTALNVTVPKAVARVKYRYSARIDPAPIVAAVREAAEAAGLALDVRQDAPPPELAEDHPWVRQCVALTGHAARTAPYGTDAAELQALAPCIIMGPGDIGVAHAPGEAVSLSELAAAIPVFMRLAEAVAGRNG